MSTAALDSELRLETQPLSACASRTVTRVTPQREGRSSHDTRSNVDCVNCRTKSSARGADLRRDQSIPDGDPGEFIALPTVPNSQSAVLRG